METNKKVYILGVKGFPYGSARIEKLKLIGKSLLLNDVDVVFISDAWGHLKKGEVPVKGRFEGIDFIYTCGVTHRPSMFLQRRWVKLWGKLEEIIYILKNKGDVAVVSIISGMFFQLLFYWLLAWFAGVRIYYPHHEEPEATLNKKNLYHRINLYLFKSFAWKMVDGVFPISSYLANKIQQSNPRLPILKIPATVDFELFDTLKKQKSINTEKYFMYCGTLNYYEVIEFIITAFEKITDAEFNLHLVCSEGGKAEEQLKQRVEKSPKKRQIQIFGYLDYTTLVQKYINASALLIPLRDTIQDRARFPHKIGEYTASGNPILTTKIGDVQNYFTNKINALVAEEYCENEFSELMNFIIKHPQKAKKIGEAGYQTGLKWFNYKSYSSELIQFLRLNE